MKGQSVRKECTFNFGSFRSSLAIPMLIKILKAHGFEIMRFSRDKNRAVLSIPEGKRGGIRTPSDVGKFLRRIEFNFCEGDE